MLKKRVAIVGLAARFVLVFVISTLVLGAASFGVRAETSTPITDDEAVGIVSAKLEESAMIPSEKLCLYYAGGDTLKERLDKVFLVVGTNGWTDISSDLTEWLVRETSASSWSTGFLNITTHNYATTPVNDFGGPGNNIAPGANMSVSIPSSKARALKGCIMNYDGARVIKKALVDSGQDRQELDNEINEYRAGSGVEGSTGSEEDAIDPNDSISRPTGTASVDTSTSTDSLSRIYGYLSNTVQILSLLMGAILVGSTIFAGIQYTTAGADSSKVSKAKSRLASNVVVLAIYMFSATVLNWILPG